MLELRRKDSMGEVYGKEKEGDRIRKERERERKKG